MFFPKIKASLSVLGGDDVQTKFKNATSAKDGLVFTSQFNFS